MTLLAMLPDTALADYDAQIRRSTDPGEPGARVEADDTLVRWLSPDSDGASCITWSRLTAGTADAVIAGQVEFFRARQQAVEWKLYDYDQPADLSARLLAAGFAPDDEEVVMIAETEKIAAAATMPDGVTVREVTGADGVAELIDVHERVFGPDDHGLRRSLESRAAEAPDSLGLVIAYAGSQPVSAARIEFPAGADFAGLWGGGTEPEWRGRGIYRALVGRRAQLAAERGYHYLQVDALPTSQPILARLGFTALARTTPYVWDPAASPGTLPA